jgi:hypothetical protein
MPGAADDDSYDVTLDDLPDDLLKMVEEARDRYMEKCLLSFSKNKSNKVYKKQSLPRILLPGQTDYTEEEDAQRMAALIDKALGDTMTNHNTAFLNTFREIMISTFGPGADKQFEETVGPIHGPTYFHVPKNKSTGGGLSFGCPPVSSVTGAPSKGPSGSSVSLPLVDLFFGIWK